MCELYSTVLYYIVHINILEFSKMRILLGEEKKSMQFQKDLTTLRYSIEQIAYEVYY